jgi:hypothetical protein
MDAKILGVLATTTTENQKIQNKSRAIQTRDSIYNDLPSEDVRLLILAPKLERDHSITGGIVVRKLEDNPSYKALSYVWGAHTLRGLPVTDKTSAQV